MAPEIFYTALYRSSNPADAVKKLHTFTPAVLHGYARYRVRFADYPGITPERGQSVQGVYVTGLTAANMQKLDAFEGSEYERVKTTVRLLKEAGNKEVQGEEKEAITYVFKFPKELERKEWDFDHFRAKRMMAWAIEEC